MGGDISAFNIPILIKKIKPSRWNTRHVVVENSKNFQKNPSDSIKKILSFEMLLYYSMQKIFCKKKSLYQNRLKVLESRGGFLPKI